MYWHAYQWLAVLVAPTHTPNQTQSRFNLSRRPHNTRLHHAFSVLVLLQPESDNFLRHCGKCYVSQYIIILSFVRNCLHGECPDIFKEYFIYPEHRYSTRQPKLYIEPHRTNVAACRIKIKGAKLWNNLSPLIKNKSHLKSFAKIVKQNYINKY